MKIMKTEFRMLIVVCSLGIIGLTNVHAVSENKKEVIKANSEMLALESVMNEDAFSYSAQEFSTIDIENEIEEYATTENLPEENILNDKTIIYSAQTFSDIDFENEIQSRE
jgi:hypothetical protein